MRIERSVGAKYFHFKVAFSNVDIVSHAICSKFQDKVEQIVDAHLHNLRNDLILFEKLKEEEIKSVGK